MGVSHCDDLAEFRFECGFAGGELRPDLAFASVGGVIDFELEEFEELDAAEIRRWIIPPYQAVPSNVLS